MKGSKHTAGPWEAGSATNNFVITANAKPGYRYVAKTCGDDLVAEANANLIAAAPELLEFLEAILDHAARLPASVCVPAANALAKARGEDK